MFTGRHGPYQWLEMQERGLGDFLAAGPAVFDGGYLVVTACDSAPLVLGDVERAAGWWAEGDLAFSPRLTPGVALPQGGFDEWLVFTHPVRAADISPVPPFVNDTTFWLHDPAVLGNTGNGQDSGEWQDRAPHIGATQRRFWAWLERVAPEAYVADGLAFIYVSRDADAYATVEAWCRTV